MSTIPSETYYSKSIRDQSFGKDCSTCIDIRKEYIHQDHDFETLHIRRTVFNKSITSDKKQTQTEAQAQQRGEQTKGEQKHTEAEDRRQKFEESSLHSWKKQSGTGTAGHKQKRVDTATPRRYSSETETSLEHKTIDGTRQKVKTKSLGKTEDKKHPQVHSKIKGEEKDKEKREKDQEKRNFRDDLQRLVSALRNTEGGDILIHVDGQKEDDRNLEFIDECMTIWLNNLISDGSSYTDNYKRLWLSELNSSSGDKNEYRHSKDYKDVILLRVEKANGLVTVDFNSKVRHDHEMVNANTLNIVSILLREDDFKNTRPELRFTVDFNQSEDRNFEVKSLNKCRDNALKDICGNVEEVAKHIWSKLKLKDNISSMSKIQDGGSYIIGVFEKTEVNEYKTKKLIIEGIHADVDPYELKEALDTKISSSILVLEDSSFENGTENLIMTEVHSTHYGFVLEVAIGFCKGIVFTDLDGPRTYHIVKDKTAKKIVRVKKEEWLAKILERCFMCKQTYGYGKRMDNASE